MKSPELLQRPALAKRVPLLPLSFILVLCAGVTTTVAAAADKLVTVQSPYPFAATIEKVESALASKGLKIFAKIDHAAAAREAGMSMPPTTVLIFGNPKGGTPLMLAQPTVALDLPLRALVREDAQGKVTLTWRQADALTAHGLSAEQVAPLAGVEKLLESSVK
ncbi:MAG: DUF302 domain-containing protein [Burkholderiales bacterium]